MFDLVKFIVREVKISPDLAPSDFHLFSHLKKFLACQQFASDDEIKVNVQNWFKSQAAEFYEAALQLITSPYPLLIVPIFPEAIRVSEKCRFHQDFVVS
ncbi:hypothetical protein AVEN_171013-1 [Araneus ventricosus]|uniref:Uncharacterized protein n=1 Tax=Araneus ventricosus TaxID=182803 RepID=A0A4Y2LCM8_ARAVE|nr:hypothetical protein AVEN_171013-1 [Araneus ventricosus]